MITDNQLLTYLTAQKCTGDEKKMLEEIKETLLKPFIIRMGEPKMYEEAARIVHSRQLQELDEKNRKEGQPTNIIFFDNRVRLREINKKDGSKTENITLTGIAKVKDVVKPAMLTIWGRKNSEVVKYLKAGVAYSTKSYVKARDARWWVLGAPDNPDFEPTGTPDHDVRVIVEKVASFNEEVAFEPKEEPFPTLAAARRVGSNNCVFRIVGRVTTCKPVGDTGGVYRVEIDEMTDVEKKESRLITIWVSKAQAIYGTGSRLIWVGGLYVKKDTEDVTMNASAMVLFEPDSGYPLDEVPEKVLPPGVGREEVIAEVNLAEGMDDFFS